VRTKDETIKLTAIISATILTLVREGMDIEMAIDIVLGEGTYKTIASDVYDVYDLLNKEGTK
jgi:hypothetical protein